MCKEVNLNVLTKFGFPDNTMPLTKRPSSGIRLQNNMKAKGE